MMGWLAGARASEVDAEGVRAEGDHHFVAGLRSFDLRVGVGGPDVDGGPAGLGGDDDRREGNDQGRRAHSELSRPT